jgi:hypothetical protein
MEQISEEIRLTREEITLSREEVRLSRESRADLHELIQQQTRRMERAAEHQGRELAKIGEAMDRAIEHLDEMGDQVRANTRAVLQLLDRFDEDGGAATA